MHHHSQDSDHQHHHDHQHEIKQISKVFLVGIGLNLAFVIVEAIAGFSTDSLSLLSDAGHNLSDVAGLLISVLALKLAEVKPTDKFTYGFSKGTILAGMANAIILSIAVGGIGYSAIHRLANPTNINGFTVSIIAFIGIIINALSALLFFRQNQNDINIRGAYLHLMLDALISLGVVVGGLLIHYAHWLWLDPLISIGIMAIIVISTWRLLKTTIRLSLDGVPDNISIDKIKALKQLDDHIIDLHHIHVWPISSSQNAMTAHVLFKECINSDLAEEIKTLLKKNLHLINIHHATLEMEYKNCKSEINH
ncbi:MAG: cation diffusion facilitator family transporter [bacterium]|nr:cation diffusion facilitator family transporter [bacterium]